MTKSLDEEGNEINVTVFTSVAISVPYDGGNIFVVQVDLDNSPTNDIRNMSVSFDGARITKGDVENLNGGSKLYC